MSRALQFTPRRSTLSYNENLSDNADQIQSHIKSQNEELAQLKDEFIRLRSQNQMESRQASNEIMKLQQQISSIQQKADQIEKKINSIRNNAANIQKEKYAEELIENIWDLLKDFRKELFSKANVPLEDDSMDQMSYVNDDSFVSSPIPTKSEPDTLLPFTPRPEINLEMSEIPMRAAETPQPPIPTTPSNPEMFESIAQRRTRRQASANVYYKEPSLRSVLTPGDPFTFDDDDGIVMQRLPVGYSREAPKLKPKKKTRKYQL